jgi:hypothetical protein
MVLIRDSGYLKDRLKRDFPTYYRGLMDGKYRTINAACRAARMTTAPTPLQILKREWKKATKVERDSFLAEIGAVISSRPTVKSSKVITPLCITAVDGRLLPAVAKILAEWLSTNKARPARIMEQMGLNVYDYTLSQAIKSNGVPSSEIPGPLTGWLAKNSLWPPP